MNSNKVDKLILWTTDDGTAWLKSLHGVGDATVMDAEKLGFVTSQLLRPGHYGSRRPLDTYVTLTEAGAAHKAVLVAARNRATAEQEAAAILAAGPCPLCTAVARPGKYSGWACSDDQCPAGVRSMPDDLWAALVARIQELEGTAS